MDKIKKKIKKLLKKIHKHNLLYFGKNTQNISNEQYDYYIKKLKILEKKQTNFITKNSPTQSVSGFIKKKFKKIKHKTPMLSLNNAYEKKQIKHFIKKILKKNNNIKNILYCCELKIDGLAVSVIYKDSKLFKISTRGDGNIGEDVTKNINMIKNLPINLKKYNNIPSLFELRGEVFMLKKNFIKINKKLKEQNKKIFNSLRNAASGSLRRINSSNFLKNKLNFFCYVINWSNKEYFPKSHFNSLKFLKKLNIPINENIKQCKNIKEIFNYYKYILNIRKKLNFEIDGIVIKVDDKILQKKIGYSSSYPRWAIAYKFPSKKGITKIKNVDFQVSRTGILTPVARLKPIYISGIKISNVNLYNFNEINRLKIMIGDTVTVSRSGDVIPKIINVIKKFRPKNAKKINIPNYCPICNSIIKRLNEDINLYCLNSINCIAQSKEKLKHFVSKNAMNIKGFGKKIINELVDKNIAKNPIELFKINLLSLLKINRINIKLAKKLLKSLKTSKNTTFPRFIYSLGIPKVGITISHNIAYHYKKINLLINADIYSLNSIKNVGINVSNKIYFFFQVKENLKMINYLISKEIGINW